MKKIKVVWLCAFANDEVAATLGFTQHPIVSPWISDLIDLFRFNQDLELHIVSPNYYTNNNKSLQIDNINVNLFKYRHSFIPKIAYNLTFNYNISQRSIYKIIEEIHPDLIHLMGSENPHYAAGIFALKNKYPILVTLQGFVHLSSVPPNIISKYIRWNRIRIENKINTSEKFFACATEDSIKELNKINPDSIKFNLYYPTTIPEYNASDFVDKKYDLVYFARVAKDKGIEDFIEAAYQLKMSLQNLKAIVIGGGGEAYVQWLKKIIYQKDLTENIIFAGFQPTQQDVFKLAAMAKVYVLPSYFDGIPGTIREAMYMQLPVVAYNVGGIPTFNDSKECITLAKTKNIPDLVEKIKLVFNDKDRTDTLVKNAYELMENRFDNNKIYSDWVDTYNIILNNHNAEKN